LGVFNVAYQHLFFADPNPDPDSDLAFQSHFNPDPAIQRMWIQYRSGSFAGKKVEKIFFTSFCLLIFHRSDLDPPFLQG